MRKLMRSISGPEFGQNGPILEVAAVSIAYWIGVL